MLCRPGLSRFLTYVYYIWPHLDYTSLFIDHPVEECKITVILFGSMLPDLIGSLKRLK